MSTEVGIRELTGWFPGRWWRMPSALKRARALGEVHPSIAARTAYAEGHWYYFISYRGLPTEFICDATGIPHPAVDEPAPTPVGGPTEKEQANG